MSCTHPFRAFPTGLKTPSGKDDFFLSFTGDFVIPARHVAKAKGVPFSYDLTDFIEVPCGKCFECKKEYARKWAFRCLFEAEDHPVTSFLTLTYDDAHLPGDKCVQVHELQKFFYRLRARGFKFRYVACGEYGERNGRPHYHVLGFGLDFEDLTPWRGGNYPSFRSSTLEQVWPFGHSEVSLPRSVSDVANYIAGYIMKGYGIEKGFLTMSRKPGIGFDRMLKILEDNPDQGKGFKALALGDGRGNLISGSIPRSLRDRLGLSVADEITRACIIKTQSKMRACGYSTEETYNYYCVEEFREDQEHLDKLAEVERNLKKL